MKTILGIMIIIVVATMVLLDALNGAKLKQYAGGLIILAFLIYRLYIKARREVQ